MIVKIGDKKESVNGTVKVYFKSGQLLVAPRDTTDFVYINPSEIRLVVIDKEMIKASEECLTANGKAQLGVLSRITTDELLEELRKRSV